jgi:hypothetical protein
MFGSTVRIPHNLLRLLGWLANLVLLVSQYACFLYVAWIVPKSGANPLFTVDELVYQIKAVKAAVTITHKNDFRNFARQVYMFNLESMPSMMHATTKLLINLLPLSTLALSHRSSFIKVTKTWSW